MPLYLYCDAAQAGLLTLAVSRLGVDMMSMGGSKLYGPRGSGFLYVRTGVTLGPVLYGGGQENGLRSGTQNVATAVGLAASLGLAQHNRVTECRRLAVLGDELWGRLQKEIPTIGLNGDKKYRLGSCLNILLPRISGETLVAYLDKENICVATGSACAASSEAPSHVLIAIGLSPEQAESSIRITLGRSTTKAEIIACARRLAQSVKQLAAHRR